MKFHFSKDFLFSIHVFYTHMHNTRDIQTAYKILEIYKPDELRTQHGK